ncbi:MAG: DUF2461 domain-containing protein [Bacteroidales bacterium]|jgi:uncharacterized protein (TIGR02453 family)|nr:DUF2461 domain-containing protein [Bacteroidales bacterium]
MAPKEILQFLNELQENNNRPWFTANKERYDVLQKEFYQFIEQLISGISKFDISVKNVTPKETVYRIYRDIRFSPNKLPYKCHFATYICQGGKKSGYAGYYFHLEAEHENYIGCSLISGGLYMPTPAVLKTVREDIDLNGAEYRKTIAHAKSFSLFGNEALKNVPAPFDKNSEYADLLRLKDYSLAKMLTEKDLSKNNLLEWLLEQYNLIYPFNDLLNKSVAFAYEEC